VGLSLFGTPRRTEEIVADLLPWLETFCTRKWVRPEGGVDFCVRDLAAFGLRTLRTDVVEMFRLYEDEWVATDGEDYSAFPSAPVQGLILEAAHQGRATELMLGHVALALARRLDALIDFDDLLAYPVARDESPDPADLDRSRALVASLPGRIEEVSYGPDGERWLRHVGDAEFLQAWLRHPEFRLPG
jgi:hypothetical protein